jgi:hypothetical protein
MEVINVKNIHPRTGYVISHWTLKIMLNSDCIFNINGTNETFESMQQKVKENCIIYNNTIVINNTDKHDNGTNKYGYIKINRSLNENELVIETASYKISSSFIGGSVSSFVTPLMNITIIKYTDDLKKLFNFVSFMN